MDTSALPYRPTRTAQTLPSSTSTLPSADPERCRLLGPTALLVQGLMGVLVLGSLIAKRQLERRKRPWKIWAFDVSKQLFGQGFVHASNVFISALVAHLSADNPCSLYFLNVLVDTTLGVFIIYVSLHLYEHILIKTFSLGPYFKSGHYGTPPHFFNWLRQLVPYLSALITMKLVVVVLFAIFPGPFVGLGNWVLDWMSATSQVIFVMMIFPLVMNILQFCLVDQILKSGPEAEEMRPPGNQAGAYERLPTNTGDLEGHARSPISTDAESNASRRRSFGILYPHETTPIPSSPLLAAEDKDRRSGYGSATPSPRSGGSNGFELPAALLGRRKSKVLLANAVHAADLETRIVLGGAVEIGLPSAFSRDGINQGKVRFKDGNGATLELFKLAAELGQDLRKLQDELLGSAEDEGQSTTASETRTVPSPFSNTQLSATVTVVSASRTGEFQTIAIFSNTPQSTDKLVIRAMIPTNEAKEIEKAQGWLNAAVLSVRFVDAQAWATCSAIDRE